MKKKRTDRAVLLYICLAALLILVIRYFDQITGALLLLWSVAFPLLLGFVMAYVLNIVLVRIEKIYFPHSGSRLVARTRRPAGILLSLLLVIGILVLIVTLVLPELIGAFGMIGKSIPVFLENVAEWLQTKNASEIAQKLMEMDWKEITSNLYNFAKNGIGSFLNSTISAVGRLAGVLMNLVIGLIFAIYILSSKEKLKSQIGRMARSYLKPAWIGKIRHVVTTANETFSSFIIGQCTEAVILGSLCTVGMLLFQFPYAPMIGAFIGATALIPIVGAYLGASVGAFMILTVDPMKALLFLIFIVVLQQLEGNLIYPKVVGSSIGLPGIWVLAAVTLGGGIGGIGGMMLGVPLAATAYKLLRTDVNRRDSTFAPKGVEDEKI